ncbi:precorrin-2 C(20)-methyltransferase [Prochlorococcus marinus]|nr:precorrin-2 C(20)-methyltransferase [Prochlorococcus marinus]
MKIKNFLYRFLIKKSNFGSLTIVGVGPGHSSLLTIAAVQAIKKAKVIVFPISSDDKKSSAAEIVKDYIKFKKKIPIVFPMARQEFEPDEIWSNAVDIIVKSIKNNKSVALLCLGDTSIFASSSNILRIIKNNHPEIITRTIPGISSFSAAAALSNFNLASKGETLIIKECPSHKKELVDLISINREKKTVLVLLKVGKRWEWVKTLLKKEDIFSKTVIAINVGMPSQIVQEASKFDLNKVPYFSLLLMRFNDD